MGVVVSVWAEKDDPKVAAKILAEPEPPMVKGKVSAYEADKSIVVQVSTRGGAGGESTFSIVKGKTRIDFSAGAKAIDVGVEVLVWADKDDAKQADRILVQHPGPAGRNR